MLMQFSIPESIYIVVHDYALQLGVLFMALSLGCILFLRKRGVRTRKAFYVVVPFILIGTYLILWNFRIINVPYRDEKGPDIAKTFPTENTEKAKRITFKTFQITSTDTFISSREKVNTVYEYPATNTGTSGTYLQLNTDYHKDRPPKNSHVSMDVLTMAQFKPAGDIKQEMSPKGCCTSSYQLRNFATIGKNAEGGEIFKAYTGAAQKVFLTDYMGTRIQLIHELPPGSTSQLTDSDAVALLNSLQPIDPTSIDFSF